MDLAALIHGFPARRVLVLGDAMLDSYLEGQPSRICREAPVPSVNVCARRNSAGGAANTAVNVRSLGGQVAFLTILGGDQEAEYLRQALQDDGVPTGHVLIQPGRRTIAKHRILAGAQILFRFEQGDTGRISPELEAQLIDRLRQMHAWCDAVILSDYGCGLVTDAVVAALRALQQAAARVLVVDSRYRLEAFQELQPTAVKPNYEEALRLLGIENMAPERRFETMRGHAPRLLNATGARNVFLTLDEDGALLLQRGQPTRHWRAGCRRSSCVAGAGDTFISAITLSLASGAAAETAGELASAAAAVVVSKDGTATCSAHELEEYLAPQSKYIPALPKLIRRVEFLRRQGCRIVFTNGCFDILHAGHVAHLEHARSLGDVLVVGVNSDASIRRLKGPSRPINGLEDRVQVLAALDCVDHLIGFDEDTARNLVRTLRPDVFVKGGNYTAAELPEAALVEEQGGVVQILPYLGDFSTAHLIERIRETV